MANFHPPLKAVAFDAYGTLFDVYSVGATADRFFPGRGETLAHLWRDKQIEYTRLRTLCDKYVSFWQVTEDALTFACLRLNLTVTPPQRAELLDQYRRLKAYDENSGALKRLNAMGLPLAILSNGDPEMLADAVSAAGLGSHFDHLLSVDSVQRFKTAPEAYQLGPDALGFRPEEILFASSNGWDIAGATWFGYTTFWVNRTAQPMEQLGVRAHAEGRSLDDLVKFVAQRV